MAVEHCLKKLKVKNQQRFFFIRGAYPFYVALSLFLMSYFYFFMDEQFQAIWCIPYYGTFGFKILLTFILAYTPPSWVVKDEELQEFV